MIACVRILNFALRLEILEKPELDGDPLVLSPAQGERRKVIDCTPEASALYIRPGMSIRDVIAMSPAAIVVDTNPARDARLSGEILAALEQLSPFVEADEHEAGCWYIDLVGLDRLLGPLPDIAQRLLQTISPLLRPRVGIASGKFPARVAAGTSGPGAFQIVAPNDTTAFLATASVAALPIDPETIQLLKQLGLKTLGGLSALSPSAVAARLGPEGRAAWELARGNDGSVVKATRHRDVIRVQLELPESTASRDAVLFALSLLVQRASRDPHLRARGARQVMVRAIYESGKSWEKRVALRDPTKGDRLVELLRLRFQAIELPQPVAMLELELTDLSNEAAHQEALDGFRPRHDRSLEEVSRQLKSRYDISSLFRVVGVEPWSRIPERRHSLMPHEPRPADKPRVVNAPRSITVEPKPSPRGKPEPRALGMRTQRREVERIEERWTIDEEWWLRPIRRRYFHLLLEGGIARTVYQDLNDTQWYAQEY